MDAPRSTSDSSLHDAFARAVELKRLRVPSSEIIGSLRARGYDAETAAHVVRQVEQKLPGAMKHIARRNMLFGGILLAGVILVAVAYLPNAKDPQSSLMLFALAIVAGTYQFVRGVAQMKK
jgi:hypothetical protein